MCPKMQKKRITTRIKFGTVIFFSVSQFLSSNAKKNNRSISERHNRNKIILNQFDFWYLYSRQSFVLNKQDQRGAVPFLATSRQAC